MQTVSLDLLLLAVSPLLCTLYDGKTSAVMCWYQVVTLLLPLSI